MKSKLCFWAPPCLYFRPFLGTLGIFVAVLTLCLSVNTVGYTQKALAIGDKLPSDIIVRNILHYPTGQASVGEFRGKLLILDFWATWCSPCVAMMPKSDSLQRAFAADVQFLPVTRQGRNEVERLLNRAPKLKGIRLPMATGDTTLIKFFPHHELPHYVWIDPAGTVVAITDHRDVNAATIRKVLDKSPLSLAEKRDDVAVPYTPDEPLSFQSIGMEKQDVVFQSLLTGYLEGVQPRYDIIRDREGRITRVSMPNAWIQFMFALAWSDDTRYFNRSRIVLEVKHPENVVSSAQGEAFRAWLKNNSWCYELIVPPHLSTHVFEIMRQDMTRLFPQYQAVVEKRAVPTLALVRTSAVDKIKSRGSVAENSDDGFGLSFTNAGVGFLVTQLNYYLQHLKIPVIDNTGYTGNVDIKLDATLSNVADIRRALAAYDLDLVERVQEVDMLVIRDAP
ncbi:TlpA family protein disulfide reductase [Chryseolinea lacunae]|uniref:Redoxin domain-containing protein n=1 Tax=Chryseolinea lacunae TaxID=2801331 RepID=A0ABS1L2S2_9BACT|nr:TlpA family protein disulfide reductase [Chryseolinea lacunae]MBL0744846.1 redoxin domain-containing protein [Chryseolinea lacunae]